MVHIFKSRPGIILWVFFTILGAFGTVWLFIYPGYSEFRKLDAESQQINQSVIILENFARKHPDPTNYLAELQRRELLLAKVLPDSPDIEAYRGYVEKCATKAKLEITQILPVNSLPRSDYNVTTINIAVRGNSLATYRFIQLLEEGPRFSTITRVELHDIQGVTNTKLTVAIYNTLR